MSVPTLSAGLKGVNLLRFLGNTVYPNIIPVRFGVHVVVFPFFSIDIYPGKKMWVILPISVNLCYYFFPLNTSKSWVKFEDKTLEFNW